MRRLLATVLLASVALALGVYPVLRNDTVTFYVVSKEVTRVEVRVYNAFITSVCNADAKGNVIVWEGRNGTFSFTFVPNEGAELEFVAISKEGGLRGFLDLKGGCLGYWYDTESLEEVLGFKGIGNALTLSLMNLCKRPIKVPVSVTFSYGAPSKKALLSYCKRSKEVFVKTPICLVKTCTKFVPGKLICVKKRYFVQREVFKCSNCYYTKIGKVCKRCYLEARYPPELCEEYLAIPKCVSWKCSLVGYEYIKREICLEGSFTEVKNDLKVVGNSVIGYVELAPNSSKALVIPYVPPEAIVLGLRSEVNVPLANLKVGNFTSSLSVTAPNLAFYAVLLFYGLTLLLLAVALWRALG